MFDVSFFCTKLCSFFSSLFIHNSVYESIFFRSIDVFMWFYYSLLFLLFYWLDMIGFCYYCSWHHFTVRYKHHHWFVLLRSILAKISHFHRHIALPPLSFTATNQIADRGLFFLWKSSFIVFLPKFKSTTHLYCAGA